MTDCVFLTFYIIGTVEKKEFPQGELLKAQVEDDDDLVSNLYLEYKEMYIKYPNWSSISSFVCTDRKTKLPKYDMDAQN